MSRIGTASAQRSIFLGFGWALAYLFASAVWAGDAETARERRTADLALVISVDVSQSVDDARYRLQMDGIADALEDPGVTAAMTSGAAKSIFVALVVWADKAEVALPWARIASADDAHSFANRVRGLRRYGGEFTCLGRMLGSIDELVLASSPVDTGKVVVDVSGDGIDNCGGVAAVNSARDRLVASGATINGLPIVEDTGRIVGAGAYRAPGMPFDTATPLQAQEQSTLDEWYAAHVIGGDHAFIKVANGYADFARAMRQKFVTEVSTAIGSEGRRG